MAEHQITLHKPSPAFSCFDKSPSYIPVIPYPPAENLRPAAHHCRFWLIELVEFISNEVLGQFSTVSDSLIMDGSQFGFMADYEQSASNAISEDSLTWIHA